MTYISFSAFHRKHVKITYLNIGAWLFSLSENVWKEDTETGFLP